MRKFQITIYILAAIAMLTGTLDLVSGLRSIEPFSQDISNTFLDDELFNAQYRFLGGIWFGIGVLLYATAKNIDKYEAILKILLWSVFLGGIGRLISITQFGLPENSAGQAFVLLNMAIETIGMLGLLWWLSYLKKSKISAK